MISKKGGVANVIAGITVAVLGIIIMIQLLPVVNNFIDQVGPTVDDGTAILLNLLPLALVLALIFGAIALAKTPEEPQFG